MLAQIQRTQKTLNSYYKKSFQRIPNRCSMCFQKSFSRTVFKNKSQVGLESLLQKTIFEVPVVQVTSSFNVHKVGDPMVADHWFRQIENVTPRPDEVHSTCNYKGAYMHQVPL